MSITKGRYKEVPRNENGQIDLPVGTKVKLQGKHCVVALIPYGIRNLCTYACSSRCAMKGFGSYAVCCKVACVSEERCDEQEVYFKEIEE
jgi:hypothetical protein